MRLPVHTLLATALALGASAASAHPQTYVGTLSNAGEPAQAAGSLGTGMVKLTLNEDDFSLKVEVSFSNLSGLSTNSHIHCCTADAGTGSAGVATPLPTFVGFPSGVASGSYLQTFDMSLDSSWNPAFITANGGTAGSAFAVFATGLAAGKAYLNIHSTLSPGGEIRAFTTLAPVPEPESYALMLAGLGALALVARRRNG